MFAKICWSIAFFLLSGVCGIFFHNLEDKVEKATALLLYTMCIMCGIAASGVFE